MKLKRKTGSELVGEVQGPIDIGIILSLEFLCAVYLGIAHLKPVQLKGHACLEIPHKQFLFNGMAVSKCIAVKKDVSDNGTSFQACKQIVIQASFTTKISCPWQTRPDPGRSEIVLKIRA